MMLTTMQTFIIIFMVMMGTMITRFLPFILFADHKGDRSYITYLGNVLPYSAIGLLVVYCLKGVNLANAPFGLPETLAIICIAGLHYWKDNALLSIGGGTAVYMILVQVIFT